LYGWAALADVGVDYLLQFALGFEDEVDGVAKGAFASSVGSDEVGFLFYFGTGIFDCDGKSSEAHGWKVDNVIAHKGGLIGS
jgi:hypothetical protein